MKLFSLMVLLCASLGGYAQDIKGRVVEQENGKKVGLPGANVYWAGTTDGVVTDAEGHFKIKWNKSGRLVASFIGYRTDTLTVKRTDKQVEIELVAGEVLDEVKVVTRGNTTIMSTRGYFRSAHCPRRRQTRAPLCPKPGLTGQLKTFS